MAWRRFEITGSTPGGEQWLPTGKSQNAVSRRRGGEMDLGLTRQGVLIRPDHKQTGMEG